MSAFAVGCTSTAATRDHLADRVPSASEELKTKGGTLTALRVGVEYLPPVGDLESVPASGTAQRDAVATRAAFDGKLFDATPRFGQPRVTVESASAADVFHETRSRRRQLSEEAPIDRASLIEEKDDKPFWAVDKAELRRRWQDPVERSTLVFMRELIGEDERRMTRQLAAPVMEAVAFDLSAPPVEFHSDQDRVEERDAWFAEHGSRMMRRPLIRMLKDTPIVVQFEDALDDFKADNVPLTEAYNREHRSTDWGRMSMRVHLSDGSDPAEVAWARRGLRVGTSQEHFKTRYRMGLGQGVSLYVRSGYNYVSDKSSFRSDLVYDLDHGTSLHVVAGDNLDFLAHSDAYAFFESPMDGEAGLLFFCSHRF